MLRSTPLAVLCCYLLLVAVFAACGGSEQASSEGGEQAEETTPAAGRRNAPSQARSVSLATTSGACEGKQGEETRTLFDYRNRIDLAVYNTVPGRYSVAYTGSPKDIEAQQGARDRAYAKAFDLIARLGLSYERAKPQYLEGYRQLRLLNDQSVLRQDIKIYREREFRNWTDCSYTYEVELAVPELPRLGGGLDKAIQELLDEHISLLTTKQGQIEISIMRLFFKLLENPAFKAKLKAALANPAFREDLRFKDDDTQLFFLEAASGKTIEISGYPKGQYRVSAIVASIIRQTVAPSVIHYLSHYDDVVVECRGYTDKLPIMSGIPYYGQGSLNALGSPVIYVATDDVPEGSSATTMIRTNDQLSAARAYEGVAALAATLGRRIENSALTLHYSGQGEAGVPRDHPASRKIVFRIHFDRRRR